jgi:hypothetical protein
LILWARAVLAGLMGGICVAGLLTSTSGELQPLVAFAIQLPGLIVIGLLVGLTAPDLNRAALAYGLTIAVAASLHILLYAIPGLDTINYTTARFNNGFSTSLFVILFGGIFLLIGQGIAVVINIYGRGIYD